MKYLTILFMLILTACTTPTTVMSNKKTGEMKSCGGNMVSSILFGRIGYEVQKSMDKDCVEELKSQGYK